MGQVVPDAIGEWWVSPIATALPDDRTVFGAISSTGDILACEMDHATGAARRVVIDTAIPDDHCCPALWAMAGHRLVAVWTLHGADALLHVKVSDATGDIASMAAAPEVAFTAPGATSYAQVHRIAALSDANQDTFWVFTRIAQYTWRMVPMTVNQATGAVTFGSMVNVMSATEQAYISTADAHTPSGQTIRFAWGYNPAAPVSEVRYVEVDAVTGAITSPVDATVSANMDGTNLPLVDTTVGALLPDVGTGRSRRLFYARPGPATPAVAYAEWDEATPDEATYKVTTLTGTTTEYGIAGPRVGYSSAANYVAGMAFPNPCADDRVAVARVSEGTSTVELWVAGAGTVLAESSTRLVRPQFPAGRDDRVICSAVSYYGTTYTDYVSDIRALFADPYTPVTVTGPGRVTILCGELRTGRILAEVPVSDASWEQVLRDAGKVEASVPLTARQVTAVPELLSYLEGPRCFLAAQRGNTILEAGPIWAHDYDGRSTLRVVAGGLLSYFDHRKVMRVLAGANPAEQVITWTGVDLATMAIRLLKVAATHTGGVLPIVLPAERSGTHERTWFGWQVASIGQVIGDLMGVIDGPDIALEPRLSTDRLRVEWVMRAGTQAQPMLSQVGDDWEWDASVVRSAVSGMKVSRDWSALTMREWATGEGQDEATLMAMREDTTLTANGFPLLESASAHSTVQQQSTLTAHARAGLAANLRAWQTWTLTVRGDPHIEDYRPGDWGRTWIPADHPYLSRVLPRTPYHRTRILRIAGGLSDDVTLTLAPQMESR